MMTINNLKKYLLLPVVVFLSWQSYSQTNVIPDNVELAVLKNIYDSLGGSGWNTKTNWPTLATWPASATSAQFGTWYGITVTNGDITKINLPNNGLSGQFPKTISSLTKLQYIYIGSNSIAGSIPSSYGNLTNLLHLTAESNNLSGSIPTTMGSLTKLTKLKLNNNSLTGSIPSGIGSLTDLTELYLNYNQLSGSIPSGIGSLTDLQYLYLRNNQLTGSLPSQLGSLTALRHFSLLNNQLSGPIPSTFGTLTELTLFDVSNNNLSGELPSFVGNWTDVTQIALNDNAFTGAIPSTISSCTALTIFTAEGNLITGFPNSILTLPVLVNLDFDDNEIITVPDFSTHVNKANLSLSLKNNKLDFGAIEMLYNKGINFFFYNPQKSLDDITSIRVSPGGQLSIAARNAGVNGSIAWERKVDAASSWTAVNSYNEDATQKTYTRTPLQDAHVGFYRFKLTNSVVTGFTISSVSIPVRIGHEMLWKNKTGVTDALGVLTKTASSGWGNAGAKSINALAASTDGFVEFVTDQSSTTSNFVIGFITTTDNNQLTSVNYGLEINTSSGQKVYAHESNATGVDLGTWVAGDYFRIARVGSQILYYKNGTQIRSVSSASTAEFRIKALLHSGKTSLVSASFTFPASEGVVPDAWEVEALKDIYDSLGAIDTLTGEPWITKTNWPTGTWGDYTSADYGTWFGITVSGGDITEIIMPGNSLHGNLPSSMRKLTRLSKIRLSNNYLGQLPSWLGEFTLLTELSLNTAGLMSSPFPDVGHLTNLTILDLTDNFFTGSMPASYNNLKNLTYLGLGNTLATGSIPPLDSLKKLTYLNFSGTDFGTNTIPSWIGTLTKLTELRLNSCVVSGNIPSHLFNLVKLKVLDLGNSIYQGGYTGNLSSSIGNLVDLEDLRLNGNGNLVGSLPSALFTLSKLEVLDLTYCGFSGALPSAIGNLIALRELYLSYCGFTGSLPSMIGNLSELTHLYLNSTSFSGVTPTSINNLTKLQYFGGGDVFNGDISLLSDMKDLSYVSISGSEVEGNLSSIGNWKNITLFYASNTNLSGEIPESIGRCKSLLGIGISGSKITSLPDSLFTLPLLSQIYFFDNEIYRIPDFNTFTPSPNIQNIQISLRENRLDYDQLESISNAGLWWWAGFLPQKTLSAPSLVKLSKDSTFIIPARSAGVQGTIQWEKRQNGPSNSEIWVSANADNEDTTQKTFKITAANGNLASQYKYSQTHPLDTALITSDPISVSVGNEVIWNGLVDAEVQDGRVVKMGSPLNTGVALSENVLHGNEDGWFDIIFDSTTLPHEVVIGISSSDSPLLYTFEYGIYFRGLGLNRSWGIYVTCSS